MVIYKVVFALPSTSMLKKAQVNTNITVSYFPAHP
jgi:hypothetical protein